MSKLEELRLKLENLKNATGDKADVLKKEIEDEWNKAENAWQIPAVRKIWIGSCIAAGVVGVIVGAVIFQ